MEAGTRKRLRPVPRISRNWIFWKNFGLFFLIGNLILMLTTFLYYISKEPQNLNVQGSIKDAKDWTRSNVFNLFNGQEQALLPETEYHDACYKDLRKYITPKFFNIDSLHLISPAFYDDRIKSKREITIFALGNRSSINTNTTLYCAVSSGNSKEKNVALKAKIKALKAVSETQEYVGYRISFPLTDHISKRPCMISISSDADSSTGSQTLPVLETQNSKEMHPANDFGVCIPPLHGVVTLNHLVEYVEMSKLIGVNKIIFYRYTGDSQTKYNNPNIDQVLNYYINKGTAVVYSWKIPVGAAKTWDHAQSLAMQHCLYTNMLTFKHLLFLDIDQILIPRQNIRNLTSLLRALELKYGTGTAVYKIRTAFFPPEVGELLEMVRSVRRTTAISKKYSKIMVDPKYIKEVGPNTAVTIYADSHGEVGAGKRKSGMVATRVDLALVHHYRQCDVKYQSNCYDYTTDDSTMNYATRLQQNYKAAVRAISQRYSSVL